MKTLKFIIAYFVGFSAFFTIPLAGIFIIDGRYVLYSALSIPISIIALKYSMYYTRNYLKIQMEKEIKRLVSNPDFKLLEWIDFRGCLNIIGKGALIYCNELQYINDGGSFQDIYWNKNNLNFKFKSLNPITKMMETKIVIMTIPTNLIEKAEKIKSDFEKELALIPNKNFIEMD